MTFGITAGTGLALMAGATVVSGVMGANAASRAAGAQADAANRASDLQYQQYQEDVARQKPFYDVGVNALPELVAASKYTPFGMDQYKQDPGYAFRLAEGQKALERSAAARGGLISGGALKAAERYGQDMGSQEYMNAFNRYQANRGNTVQGLQSLSGQGMSGVTTLGNQGTNMASNIGSTYMNNAGNIGNAGMAAAGIRNSAYGGAANVLGRMYGGGGRTGGPAPVSDYSTPAASYNPYSTGYNPYNTDYSPDY
jgi:hypothetical protein